MSARRLDGEAPLGGPAYRYHHLGIPTTVRRDGETYLEAYRMFVSGYGENEFNIEWMRFEEGCPLPEIVQRIPHVAFEVPDLEKALAGREILIRPNSPSEGVRVAFVLVNGAPVEFLEFDPVSRPSSASSGAPGRGSQNPR